MTSYSHKSLNTSNSKWGRCFIAQPTLGAAEGDNKEGVA